MPLVEWGSLYNKYMQYLATSFYMLNITKCAVTFSGKGNSVLLTNELSLLSLMLGHEITMLPATVQSPHHLGPSQWSCVVGVSLYAPGIGLTTVQYTDVTWVWIRNWSSLDARGFNFWSFWQLFPCTCIIPFPSKWCCVPRGWSSVDLAISRCPVGETMAKMTMPCMKEVWKWILNGESFW